MRLSMVFYSHLKGKGYKAPRLREYFPAMAAYGIGCDFYGLPPSPEKEDWPEGLNSYFGYRLASGSASRFAQIGAVAGASSLGRYVGTHVICHQAARDRCLHETGGIFTQPYMWPLVKKAKARNLPVILEADSDYPLFNWNVVNERHRLNKIPTSKRDPWNFWPYVAMTLKSIAAADKIIVFSEHAYSTYVDAGVRPQKLFLASPPPVKSCEVANKTAETPEFVWSGNHGVRKGLDLMLAAWAKYKTEGGAGELHLCGEVTPAQVELREALNRLPNVSDHGRISFIKFLREKRRVIVSPSFSEGLPRTVMEALACGSPVIASRASAGRFVVTQKSGWVINTDAEALKEALHDAARNWRTIPTLGDAGNEIVNAETNGYFTSVAKMISNTISPKKAY